MFQFLEKKKRFLELREKFTFLAVFVFVLSPALDVLNVSAMLTSTRAIQNEFSISSSQASWILSSYAVCFGGFILFFGRVGDIVGHHLQFFYGMMWFGIFAILICAVDNIYAAYIFRAFQGLAAASTIPSSIALIAVTLSGNKRRAALVLAAFAQCAAYGIGLVLGGAFSATSLGYRVFFILSAGLSIITAFMALFTIKPLPPSGHSFKSLDFPESILFISGVVLIILGITDGGDEWKSPSAYAPIIVGGIMLSLFFLWENYLLKKIKLTENMLPLLPTEVYKLTNVLPLTIGCGLNYAGLFGNLAMTAEFYQDIYNDSPLLAGVKVMPFSIALLFVSPIMGLIYGRVNKKLACCIGFLISFAATMLYTHLTENNGTYFKYGFSASIILSVGCCGFYMHYLNMTVEATPTSMQGVVAGFGQTLAQVGTALAFATQTSIVGNDRDISKSSLASKYNDATYFSVACFAMGFFISLFFIKNTAVDNKQDEETDEVCESIYDNAKSYTCESHSIPDDCVNK